MNTLRSVADASRPLLELIRKAEVNDAGPDGYNILSGFSHKRDGPFPITGMGTADVLNAQIRWRSWGGAVSSAAGAYQIIRNTLLDLSVKYNLQADDRFDADYQDHLGYALLRRRGWDDWMKGRVRDTAFGNNLAKEWASFPVLTRTRGQRRTVNRGESYYAGDGLNKALVDPEVVETVLKDIRADLNGEPDGQPIDIEAIRALVTAGQAATDEVRNYLNRIEQSLGD